MTTHTTEQPIYFFSATRCDGDATLKPLLGGKGANLAEMANLGLPVPAGFTITTTACQDYYKMGEAIPAYVMEQLPEFLELLEQSTGKTFGGNENPLLLSVRSGAVVSMPGMMDTVLNLGLNDETVQALARKSGNPRFAYDSYRRFLQMFGNVVLGLSHHLFEHTLDGVKARHGITEDTDMTTDILKEVVDAYKSAIHGEGKAFPQDPTKQLIEAIDAVFGSWNNTRAIAYRRMNNLQGVMGTAVNVQAMVFGNLGDTSGTGVAFTRNPSTGENKFFGEFLMNAQGEDVVAGIRTPQPINDADNSLQTLHPEAYAELDRMQQQLEAHYKDMQDIEFTIEEGRMYLLQTRTGKRTAAAMLKISTDMVADGSITKEDALRRIDAEKINELLHPQIAPGASFTVSAKGLPASPGVAAGAIVFTAEAASEMKQAGDACILVRMETSPEDIQGMADAAGVLTARGGMTSHAAVVARGMGKCCVSGCSDININEESETLTLQMGANEPVTLKKGDIITLNGGTGEVIIGHVETTPAGITPELETVLKWADEVRTMEIRTNADTPESATQARAFGAQGIGLCRTEHMFFNETRIKHMRMMILAHDETVQTEALVKLEAYQREDFVKIFTAMEGLPVTVRLLDPPLHEFLPEGRTEIKHLAQALKMSEAQVRGRISEMHEVNPMLGLRGCRLGITRPQITAMQTRAILHAAVDCAEQNIVVMPEIMVPLVAFAEELEAQKKVITTTAEAVFAERGKRVQYTIGTMIELPRAALTADKIAQHADFFSFGTNDLTQTTLGLSRDDSGKFLPTYVSEGILERDPFVSLDQSGVGQLVQMGTDKGRTTKPGLKIGICGEHGGDPDSITFCHNVGLNYVSCSPFRVPVARVAAAKAALDSKG